MSIRSFIIFLLLAVGLLAQEKQILLAITDLPNLLEKTSPQQALINAEMAMVKAEQGVALQLSNPELSYTREYIENNGTEEIEHSANFSKTFSMPWVYLQQKNIRHTDFESAKLKREQDSNQLLANARAGYVKLGLLKKLTDQQVHLKGVLIKLKQVVNTQNDEGAISQLEAKLLSMSVFGLEGDILSTQKEYRLAINTLKQMLGFKSPEDIVLTTPLPFKKVQTNFKDMPELIENHAGIRARQERISAMDQRITLEKSRIIPFVSLEGGYKSIDPGWEGYTLGLSIPVPLLNWNGPQIEKQKIRHNIQVTANSLFKQKLQSQIDNLIMTIKNYKDLLAENSGGLSNAKLVEDLIASYQEGTMSLPEFLNAIQVYRDSARQYMEQLTEYYLAVFELEAQTGRQLVTF